MTWIQVLVVATAEGGRAVGDGGGKAGRAGILRGSRSRVPQAEGYAAAAPASRTCRLRDPARTANMPRIYYCQT